MRKRDAVVSRFPHPVSLQKDMRAQKAEKAQRSQAVDQRDAVIVGQDTGWIEDQGPLDDGGQ